MEPEVEKRCPQNYTGPQVVGEAGNTKHKISREKGEKETGGRGGGRGEEREDTGKEKRANHAYD